MNPDDEPTIALPPITPIMVLPGATLFPGTLLPLHIFEPRYRAMLAWALDHDRVFAVAQMRPGIDDAKTSADFAQVAGLGLIRACVAREDGTSNLVIEGLARVQFTGIVQEAPFRIARIEELHSPPLDWDDADELCKELLELCSHMPVGDVGLEKLGLELAKVDNAGRLCDIVAHTFVREPRRRQAMLEELNIARRLRAVIRVLRSEIA